MHLKKAFSLTIYDMIAQLIFARILYPCSKSKTVSSVFPHLYHGVPISEDQSLRWIIVYSENLIKNILNFLTIAMSSIIREISAMFFSTVRITILRLTFPYEDKQKGPSKENRHDPIIGQALLLDADLVPVAKQMYPGNESENRISEKSSKK